MIEITLENKKSSIKHIPIKIVRKLEKITSYYLQGYYFAPSFKKKHWDGKLHLFNFSKRYNCYRFPTGLLEDIINCLGKNNVSYKIKDERKKQVEFIDYDWNPEIKLRKYQEKAIRKLTEGGVYKGRGILNTPIRSGKTIIAAGIIHILKTKTLFIVPSKLLLWQSQKSFSNSLNAKVGVIGDGHWTEENITVATVQTLMEAKKETKGERKKKFKKLMKNYDLIFFDECHHLTSKEWHNVMQSMDAQYKIGLSATALVKNTKEQERGVIWLKACCGNIKYKISASSLIKKGYLVRPEIVFYQIKKPNLKGKKWSKTLQDRAIYNNEYRNKKIIKLVKEHVLKDLKVTILTNRLNQIELLANLLDEYNIPFATLIGNTSSSERKKRINDYVDGNYDVLLGTVLSEGVDIPQIDVIVIAEGGKDAKKTTQRLRNLTINKGKEKAIIIDFADLMNEYFATHTKERLKVYREEGEFRIKYKN